MAVWVGLLLLEPPLKAFFTRNEGNSRLSLVGTRWVYWSYLLLAERERTGFPATCIEPSFLTEDNNDPSLTEFTSFQTLLFKQINKQTVKISVKCLFYNKNQPPHTCDNFSIDSLKKLKNQKIRKNSKKKEKEKGQMKYFMRPQNTFILQPRITHGSLPKLTNV